MCWHWLPIATTPCSWQLLWSGLPLKKLFLISFDNVQLFKTKSNYLDWKLNWELIWKFLPTFKSWHSQGVGHSPLNWCWKQYTSNQNHGLCDHFHCWMSFHTPTNPAGYQQTSFTDGVWWKHVCFNCETCLRILPSNPVQQHSLLHILQTRTAHFTEGLPPPHWLLLPAIHCCPLKVSYSPALKVSYLRALKVPKELTLKVSYYPECYQLAIPFQILQQHCGLNIILIGGSKGSPHISKVFCIVQIFPTSPQKILSDVYIGSGVNLPFVPDLTLKLVCKHDHIE